MVSFESSTESTSVFASDTSMMIGISSPLSDPADVSTILLISDWGISSTLAVPSVISALTFTVFSPVTEAVYSSDGVTGVTGLGGVGGM